MEQTRYSSVELAKIWTSGNLPYARLYKDTISRVIKENGVEKIPVVVIAIAGKSRRGKSYLGSLMIAYLEHMSKSPSEPFMPSPSDICGMEWKGGNRAVTRGIWLYEKAFTIKRKDNSEVAIMFLDTQGICDDTQSAHDMIDNLIIYITLSIATIYIHNVSKDFSMPEKKVYQICKSLSEVCGDCDQDVTEVPLFNSFTLLIRDWVWEEPYGCRPDIYQDEINKSEEVDEAFEIMNGIEKLFKDKTSWVFPVPTEALQRSNGSLPFAETGMAFQNCVLEFLTALFSHDSNYYKQMENAVTGERLVEMIEALSERLNDLPSITNPADQLKEFYLSRELLSANANFEEKVKPIRPIHDLQVMQVLLEKAHHSSMEDFKEQLRKYKPNNQTIIRYLEKLSKAIGKVKESCICEARKSIEDKETEEKNQLKKATEVAKHVFQEKLETINRLEDITEIEELLDSAESSATEYFNNQVEILNPGEQYSRQYSDKLSQYIRSEKLLHLSQAEKRIQEKREKEENLLRSEYNSAKKIFEDRLTNINSMDDIEKARECIENAERYAISYFKSQVEYHKLHGPTSRHYSTKLTASLKKLTKAQLNEAGNRIKEKEQEKKESKRKWLTAGKVVSTIAIGFGGSYLECLGNSAPTAALMLNGVVDPGVLEGLQSTTTSAIRYGAEKIFGTKPKGSGSGEQNNDSKKKYY